MARKNATGNGADPGFDKKLWPAADKLRGSMHAAEYIRVGKKMSPALVEFTPGEFLLGQITEMER